MVESYTSLHTPFILKKEQKKQIKAQEWAMAYHLTPLCLIATIVNTVTFQNKMWRCGDVEKTVDKATQSESLSLGFFVLGPKNVKQINWKICNLYDE